MCPKSLKCTRNINVRVGEAITEGEDVRGGHMSVSDYEVVYGYLTCGMYYTVCVHYPV